MTPISPTGRGSTLKKYLVPVRIWDGRLMGLSFKGRTDVCKTSNPRSIRGRPSKCRISLMVESVLPMHLVRVRFPYSAPAAVPFRRTLLHVSLSREHKSRCECGYNKRVVLFTSKGFINAAVA